MPEGPEIRRAADRLAEAIVGEPLVEAFLQPPALAPRAKALVGAEVVSVTPRGKALLTRFSNGLTLYTHNQLYGVWRVAAPGARPATTRSLRVALETARHAVLLYSASDIALLDDDGLRRHPFLSRIGPDVLDPALGADEVVRRLEGTRFRGRGLPALLLDQAFLAGMGNYLRSEVLFQARIAPTWKPKDLADAGRRRLAEALLDVPRRSYRARGIAATAGMRSDYITETPDAFEMQVFARAGEPCPAGCGGSIQRVMLAHRRLYWCPRCQR
ncbi:endonuclease VIII [Coralloluteibacterium stylophorae]|uniref:DNA-(apurinic or apyrimidinic site) lyase n=1 Tax=Coralloluteibacterium stylophorae TaxID=1776034 RepID=A0A8J7VU61_9GAMM|nr:endonuclease VIII [Coralloluteibacterium stylophorae]MBS7455957.1 endonuclease VIII [Coralloluteibacterium stylophorae]